MIQNGEIDLIHFVNHNINSEIFKIINSSNKFYYNDFTPNYVPHWKIDLPYSKEQLYRNMPKKLRHEILRKERRIQKKYNGKIIYRCFSRESEVHKLSKDIWKVAIKTYQRALEGFYQNNDEILNFLKISAKLNYLRASVLYIENKPCAYIVGLIYKNTFYISYSGYDSDFKFYSPGIILFNHILNEVFSEKIKINVIDLGAGNSVFKTRFGNSYEQCITFYLFPKSLKGLFLNCTNTFVLRISNFILKLLALLNVDDKFRRVWRNHLIAKFTKEDIVNKAN
jgi:hypothetical protein